MKELFSETVNKFNLFPVNFPVLYPLETPGTLCFSGVFRGYKMGTSARNGLKAFDEVRYVGFPLKLKFYDIFWEVVLPYFVFS